MSDWEREWMDEQHVQDMMGEFDDLWLDMCEYAAHHGVQPSYIEDEFFIDGEFQQVVPIEFPNDDNNNKKFKYVPRPGPM